MIEAHASMAAWYYALWRALSEGKQPVPPDDATRRAFVARLASERIELVADVRRFPGSRRHPQFGTEALAEGLASAGIDYRHFVALGGRRRPRVDSRCGWRCGSAWR